MLTLGELYVEAARLLGVGGGGLAADLAPAAVGVVDDVAHGDDAVAEVAVARADAGRALGREVGRDAEHLVPITQVL